MVILFHRRGKHRRDSGYVLLLLLLMVTLMMIGLTMEAPRIAQQIRRDREQELTHRAQQYVRAIQLYYRKFNRYPASIEQLEGDTMQRFLRKKYTDPITGTDEWRLIHVGEATIQIKIPGMPTPTGMGAKPVGTPVSQMSKPIGGKSSTFGGGPIIGVSSTSEQESIKEMDGKNHYNQWEFVYDPRMEMGANGPGATGQPPAQFGPGSFTQRPGPTGGGINPQNPK